MSGPRAYTIECDVESGIALSSEMESEAWNAIETLAEYLIRKKYPAESSDYLFYWKKKKNYLAKAKETYAWRAVIDAIKENDLANITLDIESRGRGTPSTSLIRSKPIMLRVAGEVTNALIHSYNNRHSITFKSV